MVSSPSSESGVPSGGLKKNVRIKKFSGKEVGGVEGWLEDAKVHFKLFRVAPNMWVTEAISELTKPAAAWN